MRCISIVCCEAAYQVNGGNNFIIVNTFHGLGVPSCPCHFPKVTILYSVTDGHGKYDMTLSMALARTGDEVLRCTNQQTVTDPLEVVDVLIILHEVPLPEPGKYWIELRCNGELISQRPFYVTARPAPR